MHIDNNPISKALYKDIHVLLQIFYLARRQIRAKYDVGILGISEAQILVQTFIENKITAKRLIEILQLEKSTISRTVDRLAKKGFIILEPSHEDKRSHNLILSETGNLYVAQLQDSNNKILSECLRQLSAREQYELGNLLNLLADGMHCSQANYLPGDHPVTLAIVRLGRGTGMTGLNLMGTRYNSTQYHILLTVKENPRISFTGLCEKIHLNKATISRNLNNLEKNKLVKKSKNERQAISQFLISDNGKEAIIDVDLAGQEVIYEGLKNQDLSIPNKLKELLEKFLKPNIQDEKNLVIQKRIEVKRIETLADRQIARGMFIDSLIKNNLHFSTPDCFYSPPNVIFGLFIEYNLVAACEVILHDKACNIVNPIKLPQIEIEIINMFHNKVIEQMHDKMCLAL
jgi:DNA-binding MarR family transcriptional regulator